MWLSIPGKFLSLLFLMAIVFDPARARAVENAGSISGTVTKASGEPAVGAFVKIRNAEKKLTFLVISQQEGRFEQGNLPAGKYEIQGIGEGMQTDPPATVQLGTDQAVATNLKLNGLQPKLQPPATSKLTRKEYDNMAAWSSHLPRTLVQGIKSKYRVVEFALAEGTDPHDVASDSKGIAWVSERETGIIGRFDPQSLTYTRIPVPPGKSGKFYLSAIEVDPQDRVWASDGVNERLIRYDPTTKDFIFFPIPRPSKGDIHFNTIRFHRDGSVWATQIDGNQLVRLDPATKKVATHDIPSGESVEGGSRPYGMAIDGNDKVWFAENGGSPRKIGKMDPLTSRITEYNLSSDARPRRMATDRDGNVWFCLGLGDWEADGKLAKIDYRTSKIEYYTPPTPKSGPSSPGVDIKRNLIWFSETPADQLSRFDPSTGRFVEFLLPTRHSLVRRIEVDRSRPNRIWFSGSGDQEDKLGYSKVGYLEVLQ